MPLPFLQTLGLTENESNIYELLLQLGEAPANIIIKEAKLKRPTTYKILYSLEAKGLVTKKDINKKIHFSPTPPTNLLTLADTQYNALDRAKKDLQAVLPDLSSAYTTAVEKPVVRFFEGIEGIKRANLEILAEKKEILAYVYIDEAIDTTLATFWKQYYKIRIRDKIYVRSITPNTNAGREYKALDTTQLRETRLVPPTLFPITIEKNIVGNKVAFFSRREDKLIATIIENEKIAQTERAIFELAWVAVDQYPK